jgi:SAM-dependent methyltransferase
MEAKPDAARLAQTHWGDTPLFLSEEERYSTYPWLGRVAEFREHGGEDVLEIGCGTGSDLLQFARHGARATGIDVTAKHVELARERVGDLAVVRQGDARQLPFRDGHFDYVYSHGVLHHSDEPERIVREMLRVLRPGGRFNVHVYSLFSLITLKGFLRHGRKWKLHIENSRSPVYIELYTGRRLRQLLGPAITIEKYECSPFPFLAPWFGWFLVAKGQKSQG